MQLALDFDQIFNLDLDIFCAKWKEIAGSIVTEAAAYKECKVFINTPGGLILYINAY